MADYSIIAQEMLKAIACAVIGAGALGWYILYKIKRGIIKIVQLK